MGDTEFLKRTFWVVLPATDTHSASSDAVTVLILLICFIFVYTIHIVWCWVIKTLHSIISYTMNGKKEESKAGEWPRLGEALKQGRGRTPAPSNTNNRPCELLTDCPDSHASSGPRTLCIPSCQRAEWYFVCHGGTQVLRAELVWIIPTELKKDIMGRPGWWGHLAQVLCAQRASN